MTEQILHGAVETGGTKTLCRVVAGDRILAEGRWATSGPDEIAGELTAFMKQACSSRFALAAVGIAAFGPIIVDPKSQTYGLMLETSKAGWAGSNLRAVLEDRLEVPVAVETDVSAAALAEQRIGAGRGMNSVAYLTVGTGIGAGLAISGRSLAGSLHPELGHIRIVRQVDDAMASVCAFHADCVEGLAAGPAVRMRLGSRTSLAEAPEAEAIIADYIGQVLATVVLAWSPDRIVVGGGVMSSKGLIDLAVRRMLASLGGYGVGPAVTAHDFVKPAALENAGLEGALMLAKATGEMHD